MSLLSSRPDEAPANAAGSSSPARSRSASSTVWVELAVAIEVGQLDGVGRAVVVPGDEHEVEDADQPAIDEVDEGREALAGHLAARELHDQVADRAQGFVGHGAPPSASRDRRLSG